MSASDLYAEVPAVFHEQVRKAVEAAFGGEKPTFLSRLGGGLSDALVLKLTVAGEAYVLRTTNSVSPLNDPERQFACMAVASRQGVAPKLVYADVNTATIVTEFIEPQVEAAPASTGADFPVNLALLLRCLHQGPDFPVFLDAFGFIHGGLSTLSEAGFRIPAGSRAALDALETVESALRPRLVLRACHNDINPGNVRYGRGRLWLIDWQTACMNDPYFDLASASYWFGFTQEQQAAFLDAYLGTPATGRQSTKLHLMKHVSLCFYGLAFYLRALQGGLKSPPETTAPLPTFAEARRALAHGTVAVEAPEDSARFGLIIFAEALRDLSEEDR